MRRKDREVTDLSEIIEIMTASIPIPTMTVRFLIQSLTGLSTQRIRS